MVCGRAAAEGRKEQESVHLGLLSESLLLCVWGGQSGGGCSWFPFDACGGLWLLPSATRAEPHPSSPWSKWRGVTLPVCWAALPLGLWVCFWGPMLGSPLAGGGALSLPLLLPGAKSDL